MTAIAAAVMTELLSSCKNGTCWWKRDFSVNPKIPQECWAEGEGERGETSNVTPVEMNAE